MIGLTFKQSLQKGYTKPYRNRNYLSWVASLPCCGCGLPADEAHHIIDVGLGGGMGTKASDPLSIPVCRSCHNMIHLDLKAWEDKYGSQTFWVCMTLHQAITDEVLRL